MKKSVVFNSITKNTEKLAEVLKSELSDVVYYGGISEEALQADVIYVGFWTQAFTANTKIKEFIATLKDKKVFVFGTCGYAGSEEFFKGILDSVTSELDSSNELIGTFMCRGKVSDAKIKGLKELGKYEGLKDELEISASHPNQEDFEALKEKIK